MNETFSGYAFSNSKTGACFRKTGKTRPLNLYSAVMNLYIMYLLLKQLQQQLKRVYRNLEDGVFMFKFYL